MDYTKNLDKFFNLHIGDIDTIQHKRSEQINTRAVLYPERIVIQSTPFNSRGFIVTENNTYENTYSLSIHEDTVQSLKTWVPVDYKWICDIFSRLIMIKFPQYKINRCTISGYGMFVFQTEIDLDFIEIC
jgi:hypothetical protein